MALGGGVHLLLQHALVDGADGPLRARRRRARACASAVSNAYSATARQIERWMRSVRNATSSPFSRRAALLGAVGVLDRHPHDRDRVVDAGHRRHARDPAPGADDHLAVDLLAQDLVRAADVVGALGRDRRRLDRRSRPRASRAAALTHDLVAGPAAVLEREVVVLEVELDARRRPGRAAAAPARAAPGRSGPPRGR